MTFPKLLVISGSAPGEGAVSELWLRDIRSVYPTDQILQVTLTEGTTKIVEGQPSWLMAHAPKLPPFKKDPSGRLLFPITSRIRLKKTVDEIVRFVEHHRPQMMLVVLGGWASISVAVPIAKRLSIPMVSLVWDPPEYLNPPGRLDIVRIGHRIILSRFYDALKHSVRCAVMSEEMGREFSSYTETIVIHSGLPRISDTDLEIKTSRHDINIGFSGSIYAHQEFLSLVEALSEVNWKLRGRQVNLLVLSNGINLSLKRPANVLLLGWRSQYDTVRILRSCDALYLPYSLDEKFRRVARLSFPTKLSTYVAARVPIFYHGPRDSSVTKFFEKYPIGLTCHSNTKEEILSRLDVLVFDQDLRASANSALECAYEEELSLLQFQLRIEELVGARHRGLSSAPNAYILSRRINETNDT